MVISDSSTLIHLGGIGRLALLRELYGQIVIPPAVWREVVEEGKGRAGAAEVEAARKSGWIVLLPPSNEPLAFSLKRDLDEGEAEAIALALEHQADLILLDESEARNLASRHSLKKTGAIGVLMRARRAKSLPFVPSWTGCETRAGSGSKTDFTSRPSTLRERQPKGAVSLYRTDAIKEGEPLWPRRPRPGHRGGRSGPVELGLRQDACGGRLVSDGTYCYATNMRSDGLPGIDLQEEGEVRIRFDPLTLLPGTFFVHAVIFEPLKHTHYDFREHAAMFKVRSDRTDYGVCVLPHRWETAGAAMPEDQGLRTED